MKKEELSPITGKPMTLVCEPDSVEYRGEKFFYIHQSYRCEDSGEMFTTTEQDAANVNQVYNEYRERHGLPFPDEIKNIRRHYGVSASMMSDIMGFGANQWRYYEADKVPNESNSRAILAIRNKSVFLDFLDAAKLTIGDKAYSKIKERVEKLPPYVKPSQPNEYSGYVSFSENVISEIVKYFASRLDGVFVTKMNKLLFYADFVKYKREGFGMTGLEYRAITHGPVPKGYGEIYSRASGVEMEEYIYPNGTSGILLRSFEEPDLSAFSESELEILEQLCNRFGKCSAGEISAQSHREKGWIECNEERKLISYSYAFDMADS